MTGPVVAGCPLPASPHNASVIIHFNATQAVLVALQVCRVERQGLTIIGQIFGTKFFPVRSCILSNRRRYGEEKKCERNKNDPDHLKIPIYTIAQ
ncbi:hypothetical protein J2S28_001752 [Rhizobium sp. SLBN-94]|nr:hypothetical protein [Rhizobium sp. SLBN-94]